MKHNDCVSTLPTGLSAMVRLVNWTLWMCTCPGCHFYS